MLARKKPVTVECFKWDGDQGHVEVPEWLTEAAKRGDVYFEPDSDNHILMVIKTLEGKLKLNAGQGDYIIKGVHGELYPCKPDIFAETYDIVGGNK